MKEEKSPLLFRLYQSIRFNRPINDQSDEISPGGYNIIMRTEDDQLMDIQFDFEDFVGTIDIKDPCVLNCMQKNPDYDTFPDILKITDAMLRNIDRIKEWYIYTGESDGGRNPLKPVSVCDAVFEVIKPDGESYRIPIPENMIKPTCGLESGIASEIKETLTGAHYITIGDEDDRYEFIDNQDIGNPNMHYFEIRPEDSPKDVLQEFGMNLHNPGTTPEEAMAEGLAQAKVELTAKMDSPGCTETDWELYLHILNLVDNQIK